MNIPRIQVGKTAAETLGGPGFSSGLATLAVFLAALVGGKTALAVDYSVIPDGPAPHTLGAVSALTSTAGAPRSATGHAVPRRGDLWQRVRRGFAMPDLYNQEVLDAESRYIANSDELSAMFERSRRYLFHITQELEKRGMPTELALLPMVESAFDPLAYSKSHASGLWQFIPATGKRYKLTQNWWFDGRRDIVASTEAALDYLKMLHRMHGDWHLALASYNWGENAVARAVERNRKAGGKTDYWSLVLPSETRRYIPKLQALKNILLRPARFGIKLPHIPNAPYFVTLPLERDIDLSLAAELAEVPLEELVLLNPGHNRPVFDPTAVQHLVLPAAHVERFLRNLDNHDQPLTTWYTYTLGRGERLAQIASAHGISIALLRQVNSLPERAILRAGTRLLVPVHPSVNPDESLPTALQPLLIAAGRVYIPGTQGVPAIERRVGRSTPI